MNCIEALKTHCENSPCCYKNGIIIEFEELPLNRKESFEDYLKNLDFILYCSICEKYYHLKSTYDLIIDNTLSKDYSRLEYG